MSIYFHKAKKRWRYSFNRIIDGVRYRSTKLLPAGWSQRQAEAYDRQKGGRLYAQAAGLESDRLTLAGAVQLYLDHRCPELANGKKAAQDLAQLYSYIEGAWLDQVDDVATAYQAEHSKSLAPATIRNRLAYLRAAVRYARRKHKYGRSQPDHAAGMSMPEVNNSRQVYAKMPELAKLWKAFEDDEARALFKMVFYMGLRWRAELLTRKPEHILRNGADVWLEIGRTKNGEPIMKFVHPAARPCLKFIPFQWTDRYFYDRWHAATAAIGRPDLHPHDLRHSLASEVLSRPGGNLDHVRAALHHKSLAAAQRYAHLYPERMKEILAATGRHDRAHGKSATKAAGKK
jgi:integrase